MLRNRFCGIGGGPDSDKISEKGIQSLTERERKILEQARKKWGVNF